MVGPGSSQGLRHAACSAYPTSALLCHWHCCWLLGSRHGNCRSRTCVTGVCIVAFLLHRTRGAAAIPCCSNGKAGRALTELNNPTIDWVALAQVRIR